MAGLLVRLHLAGYFWETARCPTRCFDATRVPCRLRDRHGNRRALRHAERRSTHVRPPDRHRELRWRSPRPAGRRPSRCGHRPVGKQRSSSRSGTRICGTNSPLRPTSQSTRRTGSTSVSSACTIWGSTSEELDIVGDPAGGQLRYIPRVVEHGYHSQRLKNLTGLETTEKPSPPPPRRHPCVRCRAPSSPRGRVSQHRCCAAVASRERHRRALARSAVRTVDRPRSPVHVRQARGSRAVSPTARAPLVPVGAARRRRIAPSCTRLLHPRCSGRRPPTKS